MQQGRAGQAKTPSPQLRLPRPPSRFQPPHASWTDGEFKSWAQLLLDPRNLEYGARSAEAVLPVLMTVHRRLPGGDPSQLRPGALEHLAKQLATRYGMAL